MMTATSLWFQSNILVIFNYIKKSEETIFVSNRISYIFYLKRFSLNVTVTVLQAFKHETIIFFRYGNDTPIYNVVSSVEAPLTWKQMMDSNKKYGLNFPVKKSVWYYSFTLNKYKSVHLLYVFFLHLIPALLIDSITAVTRTTDIR